MRRWWVIGIGLGLLLGTVNAVFAHANLSQSDPPANAVLPTPPEVIRLWFTEPLEAEFSSITLRDSNGERVDTPPPQIAPDDPQQLQLVPGDLPDGVYTVAWRVVSSADGHLTQGSFPMTIGEAAATQAAAPLIDESIPADSAIVRWLNFASMALLVGGVGFMLFVWRLAFPQPYPTIETPMRRLLWLGWLFLGLTTGLILLLQVSIITEVSLWEAVSSSALGQVISGTRFGTLWLLRVGLWLVFGGLLYRAKVDHRLYWGLLGVGGGIVLVHSLFSHTSAAQDTFAAVAADWLHLLATVVWVGGLATFVLVIGLIRRHRDPAAPALATLVAYFSNTARVAVAILIATGLYLAWLQVGSPDGLLTTNYGRVLVIKGVLMLPLLLIAGVNLLVTHRALLAGREIWGRHLRRLVGMELALTIGILAAVGTMTAIAPARSTMALREAVPRPVSDRPFYDSYFNDNIHVDLEITPGWVGENTFTVRIYTHEGDPITDASLIRLRFENLDEAIGQSELRPEHEGDGVYRVDGANLSVPGDWRIRATVQRPNQFDIVNDYLPTVRIRPPAVAPPVDDTIPGVERTLALLVMGLLWLGIGGLFAGESRLRLRLGAGMLSLLLLVVGAIFILSGLFAADTLAADTTDDAPAPNTPAGAISGISSDAPMSLTIDHERPYPLLVMGDGDLLRADDDGLWRSLVPPAPVQYAYMDGYNIIWAATDAGVYALRDDTWIQADDNRAARLVSTHGYLYEIGQSGMIRRPDGAYDVEGRVLNLPETDNPAEDFVMLGNHTHVLHNGDAVYQSIDLGLSWQPLDAPAPVLHVGVTPGGDLLAVTATGVLRWDRSDREWVDFMALPEGRMINSTQIFGDDLYVTAGGRLYRRNGDAWGRITPPDSDGAGYIMVAEDYPDTLWVLDAAGSRLWRTNDGQVWERVAIAEGR